MISAHTIILDLWWWTSTIFSALKEMSGSRQRYSCLESDDKVNLLSSVKRTLLNCWSVQFACSWRPKYQLRLLAGVNGMQITGLRAYKPKSFKCLDTVYHKIVVLMLAWSSFATWTAVKRRFLFSVTDENLSSSGLFLRGLPLLYLLVADLVSEICFHKCVTTLLGTPNSFSTSREERPSSNSHTFLPRVKSSACILCDATPLAITTENTHMQFNACKI